MTIHAFYLFQSCVGGAHDYHYGYRDDRFETHVVQFVNVPIEFT